MRIKHQLGAGLALLFCVSVATGADLSDGLQGRWNRPGAGVPPAFNGHDQVIDLAGTSQPAMNQAQSWTIWVRPASVERQAIVGRPVAATAWNKPRTGLYFSDFGTAAFDFLASDRKEAGTVMGAIPIPVDAWTFLAVTFDGKAVRLYVDGKLDRELAWDKGLGAVPGAIRMGTMSEFDKFYRGALGEFRLYGRGLSQDELAALYAAGRPSYPRSQANAAPRQPERIVMRARRNASDQRWSSFPATTLDELGDFQRGAHIALDAYGGRADRTAQATGYFHAKKIGARWWAIDPAGGYFLHNGIVALSPGGSKVLRENLAAKFGGDEQWTAATVAMMKDNGFTGAGAWSSEALLRASPDKLPYTVMVNFMESFARQKHLTRPGVGHTGFLNDAIPVFHPDFPAFCKKYAEEKFAATRDDPWLFGVFSDNELLTPDIAKYLALDPHDPDQKPNYDAAHDWLVKRTGKADAGVRDVTWALEMEFAGYAFERYYDIVSHAIRRVDPHHIYLGSRLNTERDKINPYIWRAAGKYVDVIALNLYRTWTPDQDRIADWTGWSGKPVIITEWYTKGDDAGFPNTSGAGWIVPSQEDRGKFYQQFVLNLIKSGGIVGWHWFKYMDNDPSDTQAEASNRDSNKGIMRLTYEPYAPLLTKMKAVNKEMYSLADYFDSKKP